MYQSGHHSRVDVFKSHFKRGAEVFIYAATGQVNGVGDRGYRGEKSPQLLLSLPRELRH